MTPDKISIDAARHLHSLPWISPELKSTLENDFPELKESEDERIRKEIIDWMKGGNTYDWQENKKKWIAYLERQKERKPVEWSEEDERMYKAISIALTLPDAKAYLRSWYKTPEDVDVWLKSFHPQSQAVYKTAIESILEMCNSCDIKRQFGAEAMDFWASVKVKCEEALQACPSLNESHWKPSEEQIGALNYAYCELFKRQDVEHNILGPLQKLIDNLQKLLSL